MKLSPATLLDGDRLSNVDYVTLITAWREVLQIQLQVAQAESELGKTLATLERAVGTQINEHPPAAAPAPAPTAPSRPTAPPASTPGPFSTPPP